jgi:hypothetical protein
LGQPRPARVFAQSLADRAAPRRTTSAPAGHHRIQTGLFGYPVAKGESSPDRAILETPPPARTFNEVGHRVLVVDDDPVVLALTLDGLGRRLRSERPHA